MNYRLIMLIGALLISQGLFAQDQSSYYTNDYQQEALEIFGQIVAIRSAAGHGKVPEVATFLAERFVDAGFDKEDVHIIPQTLSTGEETASLVVRYPGNDASGKRPILLIAHMDVVDALPEDWERDPFTLIEEDGYFFGRGSLDDKFGITTLTTTFLRLKREGFTPTRDLVIAFSGDEESGMETTRALATTHRNLTDAEYVLNADGGGGILDHENKPVAFLLQAAEKTFASFFLTIRNPGGHSSVPRADNAIYELATVLKNIEAYVFPAQINDVTKGYFEASAGLMSAEIGDAMRKFAADPADPEAHAVLDRIPEQSNVMRTTCVATMLSAGHAENALPQSATATVNCRIFPGTTAAEVQAVLAEVGGNESLEIAQKGRSLESPVSPITEEVASAISSAIREQYPGVPVIPNMAAYGTDGKEMRIAGMPTYGVMGLFIYDGDMFAHGLNERVPVFAFYNALDYWYSVLHKLAGP